MVVTFIGTLLIIGVVCFLYKKGVIKNIRFPVIKNKYVYNHNKNHHLTISYEKFNGMENYPFMVNESETYTLQYEVKVDEGTLALKCKNGKDILFEKTFEADEKGAISFTAKHSIYYLLVIGSYTKGGCNIEVEKK